MICYFLMEWQAIVQLEAYREKLLDKVRRALRVKDYDILTCHNCEKMSADVFWSDHHHLLVHFLPPLTTKTKVIESIFH